MAGPMMVDSMPDYVIELMGHAKMLTFGQIRLGSF